MHKETKILIFEAVLAIAILLFLFSCGTRKASKQYDKHELDSISIVLKQNNFKIDSLYTFDFLTLKIYPIDITKPIILNGNVIQNANIEQTNKKEYGKITKSDKGETKTKTKVNKKTVEKEKVSEKDNSKVSIWIGGFFCLALLLYFLITKILKL